MVMFSRTDAIRHTACAGPVGGHVAQPGVDGRARVAGRTRRPPTTPRQSAGIRPASRPATSSRPEPVSPATPRPRRADTRGRDRGPSRRDRPDRRTGRLRRRRARRPLVRGRRSATSSRPSISSTRRARGTARPTSAVATRRPSRRTVTRSADPSTSSRWWEMNRIAVPLRGDAAERGEQPLDLRTGQRRRRLVEHQQRNAPAVVAVEGPGDGDRRALRLGQRRRPSRAGRCRSRGRPARARARSDARGAGRAGPSGLGLRARAGSCPTPSSPRRGPRSWWTKRSPASRAATAEPSSNGTSGDFGHGAVVGLVVPGEDLDDGRLPGAVLADERMDLAGGDLEVDVVERTLSRERLAQAVQTERDPCDRRTLFVATSCHRSAPTAI